MRRDFLSCLICPACGGSLALTRDSGTRDEVLSGHLDCGCGARYRVIDGVPDLVFPPGQSFFAENAEQYDALTDFIARLLNEDESAVRTRVIDWLELEPGARVLDVACGPASSIRQLVDRTGPTGSVVALDISAEMIRVGRGKRGSVAQNVEFVLANGSSLPFPDHCFDAVHHIGTLNRFADVKRALAEMARVVKIGGKVIAADEGLGPWLADTGYGAVLKKFGGLFDGSPPVGALPANVADVKVRWLMGHAYFAIEFRTTANAPALNLDVPLPGRSVTVRDVLDAQKDR